MFRLKNYNLILIFLGAIPGSLIRWQLQDYFVANLIGAFVIGMVMGMKLSESNNLMLGFGFCGSLTTYSTWIIHSINLLFNGSYLEALSSIVSLLLIGLTFACMGFFIGNLIRKIMLIQ